MVLNQLHADTGEQILVSRSSSGIQVIGTVVIPCLLVLENANKPISINSYAIVWRLVRQGAPHATRSL